jgi:predicted GNAT family N-acyltransferase
LPFRIEPLGDNHDRAAFSCGSVPLDRYLQTQARQAVEKKLAAVFVLTEDGKTILGYYTLSSYVLKLTDIPEAIRKKLTKMGEVPATLLGRLARSTGVKGKGYGPVLLADALKRAFEGSASIASWAVVVDAKDQKTIDFYKEYEFIELPNTPNRLFLPMSSIRQLFEHDDAKPAAPAATVHAESKLPPAPSS